LARAQHRLALRTDAGLLTHQRQRSAGAEKGGAILIMTRENSMTRRALLSAVVASALVLGCAVEVIRTNTRATCRNQNCEIMIMVKDGQVSVDIDELEIRGNKNVHIIWRLPPGYEFIASTGDGVFFKRDDRGEFDDPYVTDEERGQPSANKRTGKIFHWLDRNSVAGPYEYKIQFHDRSGKAYYKDPTIMNGA
jgi:hypothetical protein